MKEPILLKCGCVANAVLTAKGNHTYDPPIPSCAVHNCTEVVKKPDLARRKARCAYGGNVVDSDYNLAFFEYRGPGSPDATDMCTCGYHKNAHTDEVRAKNPLVKCTSFTPRGPNEYDKYYCGCYGWD